MAKNRRPQMPKRRNFVAKHAHKFNRAQTHRDRTKYSRYEDDLQDRLDDFLAEPDELDEEADAKRKEEFKAKLAGEKYDPNMREEWENFLDAKLFEEEETWDDYEYSKDNDYGIDFDDYDY